MGWRPAHPFAAAAGERVSREFGDDPLFRALAKQHPQDNAKQPIAAMPGQGRWGVNTVCEALDGPVRDGLSAVLLFGVLDVSGASALLRLVVH